MFEGLLLALKILNFLSRFADNPWKSLLQALYFAEPSPFNHGRFRGFSTGFRIAIHNNVFSIPETSIPLLPLQTVYNPPGIIEAWRPIYNPSRIVYGVRAAHETYLRSREPINYVPSSIRYMTPSIKYQEYKRFK